MMKSKNQMTKSRNEWSAFKISAIAISALLITGTCAFGQSVTEIVKQVEKRYHSLKTFSAEFDETFTWTLAKESRTTHGRFFIKKPDRFRLETEKQIISSDGTTVWRYAIQDSQVFVTDAESDPEFPPLKNLLFDYVENYSHVSLGEEVVDDRPCYQLKLIPKIEESYITEMRVWIDKKEKMTKKVAYTDIQNNVTTYVLDNIETNEKIKDDIFVFDIPAGVEVIDTR
ncbi:MAG: outer membrane lipoprotein carrier protein LolA [Gemmatimonadota bacterium]|nr:MAG: outer membrane lipoprotein carrier protein LolA [Gemmatimonadota bacterium]